MSLFVFVFYRGDVGVRFAYPYLCLCSIGDVGARFACPYLCLCSTGIRIWEPNFDVTSIEYNPKILIFINILIRKKKQKNLYLRS